jgi:hypothetical protein
VRKPTSAPGWLTALNARFGVAALRSSQMSPLWLSAHARAFYSLIKELFNCETMGICLLAKLLNPKGDIKAF